MVKLGSLTGKQIKLGSLTGQQVVGSSLTGVSASSLAAVQYASITVGLTNENASETIVGTTASAGCPAGLKAIGGGATLNNDRDGIIHANGPTPDRNGWTAHGEAFGNGVSMTITAICTRVASATG